MEKSPEPFYPHIPYTKPGKPFLAHPREWGVSQCLFFLGLGAVFFSAFFLNWISVEVDFRGPIFGTSMFKGTFHFKMLDNTALTAIVAVLLFASLILSLLKGKAVPWLLLALSLGLLGCFFYYLASLAGRAYDNLGILDSLLEMLRKIPLLGPSIAELTRQTVLDSIKSVRPQAGLFIFAGGDLLLLAASVLRFRRRPTSTPPVTPYPVPGGNAVT